MISYKKALNNYVKAEEVKTDDLQAIARDLSDRAEQADIPIEKDPDALTHTIGSDLRDNVSPQIY